MNSEFRFLNLQRCLMFVLLLFAGRAGAAGLHIAGGEFTYCYIGSGKYQIDLDLYTHCLSKPDRIFFNISSPDTSFTPYSVEASTLTDLGEVTLLCNGDKPQSKCKSTDSTVFGIRHFRATATVNLSNQNVCEYVFSYKGGKRSFWSTNGGAGEQYYTEAYLRNCNGMDISSPAFGEKPRFLAAEGICQLKTLSVSNRNTTIGKSELTFALTTPLTGGGMSISYNNTFSSTAPVSHYKVDDPFKYDSSQCAGFRIDSLTGSLFFKASKKETGAIGILITNTVDGVVVSRVMRDYLLSVTDKTGENSMPRILADDNKSEFTVKVGSALNISFKSFDSDPNDSLSLYAYNLPEWSTFKISDSTKKWPTANLSWTPIIRQARKEPYVIHVQVQDDVQGCEDLIYHGVSTRLIYITVKDTSPEPLPSGLHIAGGELTYKYIGSNNYQLDLDLYTHCLCKPDSILFNISSPNPSFTPFSVNALGLKDLGNVTLVCDGEKPKGGCDSRDSTVFGIRHWRATATVTLSNQGVCEYIFSYKGGKRSFWSTNGGAGEQYYTEAYLRNCGNMNISSPAFDEKPRFLAAQNICQLKRLPMTDRNASVGRSSLKFSMTAPLTGAGAPIAYKPNYSFTRPVSYQEAGDPYKYDSAFCVGFRIDSMTGTLFFNANTLEKTYLGIQVENTVDGKVVSRVTRDYLLNIIYSDLPNRRPQIVMQDSIPTYRVRVGSELLIDIKTFDQDPGDSVKLYAFNLPKGSSFKIEDSAKNWPTANFKWKPTRKQIQKKPYLFYIMAQDDAKGCEDFNYSGIRYKFFQITVEDNMQGMDSIMAIRQAPERNFKIYPNPSAGITWVEGLAHQPQWIRLNDVSGRQYNISSVWTDGKLRVDLTSMQPGMYMLEAGDQSASYRMVLYRLGE